MKIPLIKNTITQTLSVTLLLSIGISAYADDTFHCPDPAEITQDAKTACQEAGGTCFTDSQGILWEADTQYEYLQDDSFTEASTASWPYSTGEVVCNYTGYAGTKGVVIPNTLDFKDATAQFEGTSCTSTSDPSDVSDCLFNWPEEQQN